MDIGWLNSLMSASEAGVVIGVILEGTEYVPPIKRRYPLLEKIGFAILVLSLIADWHFQTKINERHTNELIAARTQIAKLNNEIERLNAANLRLKKILAASDERIAVLNAEAAKLEAVTAGRNLKPTEITALGKSLKRFAGQTILEAKWPRINISLAVE